MNHLSARRSRTCRHALLRSGCPLLAAALFVGGPCAHAQTTLLFDPNGTPGTGSFGSGPWDSTTAIWSDGSSDTTYASSVTATVASFAGTPGTTGATAPVTLNAAVSADEVLFSTTGYTVGGTGTLTTGAGLTNGGGITSNMGGGTATISVPIANTVSSNFRAGTGDTLVFNGSSYSSTGSGSTTPSIDFNGNINWSVTTANLGSAAQPAGISGFGIANGNSTGGTFNMTGGTFNSYVSNVYYLVVGAYANSPGVLNLSGGTLNVMAASGAAGSGFLVGDGYNGSTSYAENVSTGTVNLSGTGVLNLGTTTGVFLLGNADGGSGTFNLNTGGTLSTLRTITAGTTTGTTTGGASVFNFNGGTLQATGTALTVGAATTTGLTLNVRNGGAVINTNGFAALVNVPLVHSGVAGDNATDGGLTKTGAGILTLASANTYTGATKVNAGGLTINANGGLSSGSVTLAAGTTLTLGAAVTAAHSNNTSTLTLANATVGVALDATTANTVQDTVAALVINGVNEPAGTYGSSATNVPPADQLPEFTGDGEIVVTEANMVPEPSTWATMLGGVGGLLGLAVRRQRSV